MINTTAFAGNVRPMAVAGQFYPSSKEEVEAELNAYFATAASTVPRHLWRGENMPPVRALIVPHAGWVFSGEVAAQAFAQIPHDADYDHIFLLGPSHHVWLDGASIASAWSAYQTPLGTVPVDTTLCQSLIDHNDCFTFKEAAHTREHCLEVQLPFLQHQLQKMPPIIPIIIGTQDYQRLKEIAAALTPYYNSHNLFVISSDFSHYPAYNDACRADSLTGNAIATGSLSAFLEALEKNDQAGYRNLATSACGQSAIAVLLMMAQASTESLQMHHLLYRNSGDSPYGGRDQVVGYHAFVQTAERGKRNAERGTRKAESGTQSEEGGTSHAGESFPQFSGFQAGATESEFLPASDRTLLKQLAWQSIRGERIDSTAIPATSVLHQKLGAFVTLNEDGHLRGCIGHFGEDIPLWQVVKEMAHAAAYEDPRFRPVRPEEYDRISLEISVLTPLHRIHDISEFHYGEEGIYMRLGYRSGTFLPQVAQEVNWTKEEFLGHCARDKAGIGWDGWKDPATELYTYRAIIF